MFSIDEFVFYGIKGVCRVTAICDSPFDKKDTRQYYVLKPVGVASPATFYAPVDNEAIPLRAILSDREAQDLLMRAAKIAVLEEITDKQRRDWCRLALTENNPESYICVIKTLSRRRADLERHGKQLSTKETELERTARFHLTTELTVSLGWNTETAQSRLEEALWA